MELTYDVAAIGELLIDLTEISADREGYPTLSAHPGGAPANFLSAMSRLGARTAMLGKVGDDAFGKMLLRTLRARGIDTRGMLTDAGAFTTLAFVTLDARGDREFSFARKPGADTLLSFDQLDLGVIDRAAVLHFGSLSLTGQPARDATVKAVDYARSRGKLISYDPNLRRPLWYSLDQAGEQMLWGLGRADVVKLSRDELEFLFGEDMEKGAARVLEEYGVKLLFVTCGAEGCFYKNRRAQGSVPALSGIKVVDTTGAGDVFGGCALWKLLETGKSPQELDGAELREIARFASAAAGLSTTRAGGISSVPGREEIETALRET